MAKQRSVLIPIVTLMVNKFSMKLLARMRSMNAVRKYHDEKRKVEKSKVNVAI